MGGQGEEQGGGRRERGIGGVEGRRGGRRRSCEAATVL